MNKNSGKRSLIPYIIALIVVIISIIYVYIYMKSGNDEETKIEVTSVFEYEGDYFLLKNKDGEVLLRNIKNHGEFINGTTNVQNSDGQCAIIDGNGDYVVPFGKYNKISQVSTYGNTRFAIYEARDNNQSYFLKYDGSILYKDDNDKLFHHIYSSTFFASTNIVIIYNDTKYMVYNNNGDLLKTFDKIEGQNVSIIESQNSDYDTILYNGISYVFNSIKGIELISGRGNYKVIDSNIFEESLRLLGLEKKKTFYRVIVQAFSSEQIDESGVSSGNGKTYVFEDDKLLFELDTCNSAKFDTNSDMVKCITSDNKELNYNIKGKLVK